MKLLSIIFLISILGLFSCEDATIGPDDKTNNNDTTKIWEFFPQEIDSIVIKWNDFQPFNESFSSSWNQWIDLNAGTFSFGEFEIMGDTITTTYVQKYSSSAKGFLRFYPVKKQGLINMTINLNDIYTVGQKNGPYYDFSGIIELKGRLDYKNNRNTYYYLGNEINEKFVIYASHINGNYPETEHRSDYLTSQPNLQLSIEFFK